MYSVAIHDDGRLYLYPCLSSNHRQALDIAVANHKQVWRPLPSNFRGLVDCPCHESGCNCGNSPSWKSPSQLKVKIGAWRIRLLYKRRSAEERRSPAASCQTIARAGSYIGDPKLLVHSARFPRLATEKPFAFCKGSSGSEWHGRFAQHLPVDGAAKQAYSALPSPRGDRQARRMRQ